MRDVVRTLELKRITTKWITRGIFFFYLWYFSVSLSYPSFPSHPYHSQVLKIILFLTVSFSFPLRLIFLLKVWEKQWWKNNVETLNSWVRILTSVFYQKYKFIKYICKKTQIKYTHIRWSKQFFGICQIRLVYCLVKRTMIYPLLTKVSAKLFELLKLR